MKLYLAGIRFLPTHHFLTSVTDTHKPFSFWALLPISRLNRLLFES
jgi:hypothetical protein